MARKPLNLREAFKDEDQADKAASAIEAFVNSSDAIDHPFEQGKTYLIRTVTMVDVGRVRRVTKHFIIMENASWIADTGRFTDCLKNPNEFKEVEPFANEIYVNLDAIIDATPWPYTLPNVPK